MTKGEAGYVLTKLRSNFWEDNLSAKEASERDLQIRLAGMEHSVLRLNCNPQLTGTILLVGLERNANKVVVTKSPVRARRVIVSDKTTFSHQVPTVSNARSTSCF